MNIYYFLVPFLFFVLLGILGAILLRLKIKKETKNTSLSSTQNENDKKPDPHGADGGGHPPKTEEKNSSNIMGWVWTIMIGILIFGFLYWLIFVPSSKENKKEPLVIATHSNEVLDLITYGFVSPEQEWVTPSVSYKNLKIRTEGHSCFVRFTSKQGNWTKEKFFIPKEGDVPIILPSDSAQEGSILISVGTEETKEFRVQLYKKIMLR